MEIRKKLLDREIWEGIYKPHNNKLFLLKNIYRYWSVVIIQVYQHAGTIMIQMLYLEIILSDILPRGWLVFEL